jgi:hypothetical protein
MLNVYSLIDSRVFAERPLFSDEFRRIFFRQYRKQSSSKYFEIWECETESGLPARLEGQEKSVPRGSRARGKRAALAAQPGPGRAEPYTRERLAYGFGQNKVEIGNSG